MAWTREDPKNLSVRVNPETGMVEIVLDPEGRFGPSSSGKTTIVSKGVVEVPGYPGLTISLTAYTK